MAHAAGITICNSRQKSNEALSQDLWPLDPRKRPDARHFVCPL